MKLKRKIRLLTYFGGISSRSYSKIARLPDDFDLVIYVLSSNALRIGIVEPLISGSMHSVERKCTLAKMVYSAYAFYRTNHVIGSNSSDDTHEHLMHYEFDFKRGDLAIKYVIGWLQHLSKNKRKNVATLKRLMINNLVPKCA
jgi:hypothetical protein